MLAKNKIKIIQSLTDKKGRKEKGIFIIEGEKMVQEAVDSGLKVLEIYGLAEYFENHDLSGFTGRKEIVTEDELKKISSFTTPNSVLCVVRIPEYKVDYKQVVHSMAIGLDSIHDPGNLGTIIRTADWFGITDIFCSPNSVDVYNPKVVQGTMGAIARVRVHYISLSEVVEKIKKQDNSFKIYGAFMEGKNIMEEKFEGQGMIIFGHESKGISKDIEKIVDQKITIPRAQDSKMESLNVAVAAGIVCERLCLR